jgi:hypothetical protein
MQTNATDRQSAEKEIFALRRKAEEFLAANNVERFNELQDAIIFLQKRYGATKGAEKGKNNARTA